MPAHPRHSEFAIHFISAITLVQKFLIQMSPWFWSVFLNNYTPPGSRETSRVSLFQSIVKSLERLPTMIVRLESIIVSAINKRLRGGRRRRKMLGKSITPLSSWTLAARVVRKRKQTEKASFYNTALIFEPDATGYYINSKGTSGEPVTLWLHLFPVSFRSDTRRS